MSIHWNYGTTSFSWPLENVTVRQNGGHSNDTSTPAAPGDAGIGALDLTSLSSADGSILLTPDALLAYCQSRLKSIDGQLRGVLYGQQVRNTEVSAIQQVLQKFNSATDGVNGDSTTCTNMEKSLYGLIRQLKDSDPGCPELPKLTQIYNNLVYSGTGPTTDLPYVDEDLYPANQQGKRGDNILSTSEIQGYSSGLQACASDLNSDSELQMIQVQSLMSQRQTAVQLTTNLVQSLGDQAQKIVENVGR
jgi:hypothetical protein